MFVTKRGILIFVGVIVIPSVISFIYLPERFFFVSLFIFVLIGSGILFYYSKLQEKNAREFDELINSYENFEDFIDNYRGYKYKNLINEYKINKRSIIEKKDEIIIYPRLEQFNIGDIKMFNLASYKHKIPLIRINKEGISYQDRELCRWEEFYEIVEGKIPGGYIKSAFIVKKDGSYINIPIEGFSPIRVRDLELKVNKYIKKNKIIV